MVRACQVSQHLIGPLCLTAPIREKTRKRCEQLCSGMLRAVRAWAAPSVRRPAATEVEDCTGGERILFRHKPCNHRGNFIYLKKSFAWDTRKHKVNVLLGHLLKDAGPRCRWCYAIHRDVLFGSFLGERFCKSNYSGFRRTIRGSIGIPFFA